MELTTSNNAAQDEAADQADQAMDSETATGRRGDACIMECVFDDL